MRKVHQTLLLSWALLALWPWVCAQTAREARQKVIDEEQGDYFRKWLSEDVLYIITDEEGKVFENLTTVEEKERFIEQFWRRRDPDPRTAANEFKEEHYRRIAYANERFSSGQPGWKTDRGKIYIIHGPPDQIERYPAGQYYQRPASEGGGATSSYPYEVWRYRRIEGIGDDIELEFVDPTLTKEYRLALWPEEKDALLYAGPLGATQAEEVGLATKADRPAFNRGAHPIEMLREKDLPFQRLDRFSLINRPPEIKYKDLKEIVEINVTYSSLPFTVKPHYFRLDERRVLVPLTLDIDNRHLTFEEDYGVHTARVGIYGIVTSLTKEIVQEFEEDLLTSYRPELFEQGRQARSVYQRALILEQGMRYRLDLVVKDLNSGKMGVTQMALVPTSFRQPKLSISSVVLSDHIQLLQDFPREDRMFTIGDVLIYPSVTDHFSNLNPLGVYLQLYDAGIDQTTLRPHLEVSYEITREGQTRVEFVDRRGESTQFFSANRVVLIRELPARMLEPGPYQLNIRVRDLITGEQVSAGKEFQITGAPLQVQK